MDLSPDQVEERRELLQRCLSMSIIRAQGYANQLTDEQFLEAINGTTRDMAGLNMKRPGTFPDNYFGSSTPSKTAGLSRAMSGSNWSWTSFNA